MAPQRSACPGSLAAQQRHEPGYHNSVNQGGITSALNQPPGWGLFVGHRWIPLVATNGDFSMAIDMTGGLALAIPRGARGVPSLGRDASRVLLFRVVGAEPLLMMFEVVQEVTAATRLPEAARSRRVGTDFSLVASSPSTCDDNARRLTRRVGLGRAGLRSPPLGRPMEPGC